MNFCDEIENLCHELEKCQIQNCERLHPRSFSGVCIGYLQNICQQSEYCGLHHFSQEELDKAFDSQPINGIYKHNLCYKKCNNCNCKYLHPPWLERICVHCENKNCDKKQEGLWHTTKWTDIRKKVYEMYNINKLNPEKLGADDDSYEAQKYNFDKYCIKYFQGICPHHRCQKPHKNWEDIKDIGEFQNLEDQVIKPCIKYDEIKNKYVSQPQTLKCAVFMQKNSLQLMINQIQQRPQADIIFILDCTKSMDKWIEVSKKSISSIIAEFKKKVQINAAIRMAAVCYKDFSDGPNHIQYHNFTVRPEEIEKFFGNLKIEGGDDIPEDLQGALDMAYKLKICKDPASLLQIFIITDAPCHGRKYHNLAYDQRPDAQDLEEKLQKFVDLKQRFFLSFLQINEQTQKMEKVIQSVVKNYQSAKIADKQFSDYIVFSLASTYNKSISMNVNKEYEHVCSAQYTKQKDMPYMYNNRKNENYYDFFLSQILKTQKKGDTLVFIENNELQVSQQGQQQEVFKGFDQKNNVHIIIKIQKNIIKKFNSKTLTADDIDEANKIAESKYKQQLIAKQLSHHFNFCCNKQNIQFTPLYYATPYLYQLEKPFKGVKLIYAESYIDIDQPWKKYTNNTEYRDECIDLTAFSHFTYQYTNCQMIVTDLQGKTNILSDPAIHTSIYNQNLTDSTNLKDDGCRKFFLNQHPECLTICRQLKLNPTEIQQKSSGCIEMQQSNVPTQQEDAYFGSKISSDNRFKVCCNCNALEKLEQQSDTCELCDSCKKEQQNKETVNCQCCNAIFEISLNFEQIFGTVVEYCQDCQNKQCHTTVARKCYYCSKRICLQTIKEIQINGKKTDICADAHYFLRQVKCKNCQSNYNFKQLLSQEDYYKNDYNCGCKNR
ncbi:unnamed protein product (macronuclear) [Paramecium tetraurelia]|uniref:Alpha-type protein kinase domain-containing protein n=1 Tax=Paramecium tetraurelia TaxID=5888 RepID=A0DU34_PARTE|nr:uncharacterized protein GSPATT00020222001 [Paramecium tetraurelia]CAK86551.1 unnamed protein product [Paramecium tetraurelia]|eukprot:XP_001453948.1 hypothetical protein (macronuclear) [Paramecium tetraurelia strain d4-2]